MTLAPTGLHSGRTQHRHLLTFIAGLVLVAAGVTVLDVSLAGSGDAELQQLVARDVHAIVNGSGRILVDATNTLDASVPGSGVVVYSGNPVHVTSSITGSGAVTRG
jgi:hypothetical protein